MIDYNTTAVRATGTASRNILDPIDSELRLKLDRGLRPRSWLTISRMIEGVYHVRVSCSCLRLRLTPGAMERHRRRSRKLKLKHPERRKEQIPRYREIHRDRLLLRRKMLMGKMERAVV